MYLDIEFLSVSASCEHGSECSKMFDNIFIALKPMPPLTNKKVPCIELYGSEILNVEVVDSPKVPVYVC